MSVARDDDGYFAPAAAAQTAIDSMTSQRSVSERSWRRLVEVVAELNDAGIARVLVACGLPLECTYAAIGIAARNNHLDTLRVLIQAGAPVNGEWRRAYNQ